ncbi:MAG: dipeptide ABC transporter ATP-binding protein [Flavobacteriales bacterium]
MKAPLLKVENLTVAFGEQPVVHNVTFNLNKGELLALVGESGSGKTITSAAIMGLLPRGGRMTNGCVFHHPSSSIWAAPGIKDQPQGQGLSMVFQDPMSSLNPSMRVGWQVAEGPIFHKQLTKKDAKAFVLKLFEEVELPDPSNTFEKYPHELSGGQKQRIMIALALAANPEVLIADEPTTALDTTVQKSILELLKKLQREREIGILFITHDLGVVQAIADRVLVMRAGEIVEQGDVTSVLNQPQHAYTKALIEARKYTSIEEPPPASPPLVIAKNLGKSYTIQSDLFGRPTQTFQAVDSVNLSISRGERVGLIGESGSGKSTLGRLLIGMLPSTQGSIEFNGMKVNPEDKSNMRSIRHQAQLVFQDPYGALNPKLAVGFALTEVMEHRGVPAKQAKQEAIQLLHEVGLNSEDAQKKPHEFSGGQRQRLVIARALAMQPMFLVLDESVAALDIQIQKEILALLKRIGDERRLTFLFISHDLDVVSSFCNRLLIMKNGRIVESGETHEIITNPKTAYTTELLDSRPGNLSLLLS